MVKFYVYFSVKYSALKSFYKIAKRNINLSSQVKALQSHKQKTIWNKGFKLFRKSKNIIHQKVIEL